MEGETIVETKVSLQLVTIDRNRNNENKLELISVSSGGKIRYEWTRGREGVDHGTLLASWFSGLLCGARVLLSREFQRENGEVYGGLLTFIQSFLLEHPSFLGVSERDCLNF